MKRALFQFILLLITYHSSLITIQGQTSSSDVSTPAAQAKGTHPLGSYGGSGFDAVNQFSGNLSLTIPLAAHGGRAGMGAGLALSFNSKVWRTELRRIPRLDETFSVPVYGDIDTGLPQFAPGWVLVGPGRMFGRRTGWANQTRTCADGTPLQEFTLTTLTLSLSNGTEVEFRDDLTDGRPLAVVGCAGGLRGKTWHSTDGSAMTFVADTDVFDRANRLGKLDVAYFDGWVVDRNGTRMRVEGGRIVRVLDRNGNRTEYGYESPSSSLLTTITDTLGRKTTIAYVFCPNDPARLCGIEITSPGLGNAPRKTTIRLMRLGQVLKPGETLKTFAELFPPSTLLRAPLGTFNPKSLVSEIVLPSGHTWKFLYNSYGEIARVETPALGAIEWDYAFGGLPGYQYGLDVQIYRHVTERRVFTDAVTLEGLTRYTPPALTSQTTGDLSPAIERHYDRDRTTLLAQTKHFFKAAPLDTYRQGEQPPHFGHKTFLEGKELETQELDVSGNPLRVTRYTWEQRENVVWALQASGNVEAQPSNDPRLTKTRTIWVESDPDQVTESETTYDRFNNPLTEKVFDFGNNARGPLLREVRRTYLQVNPVNGRNYQTDPDIHLRSLVETERILDGAGQTETLSRMEYDRYAGDADHVALLPYIFTTEAAKTRSAPFNDPNVTTRGNVTATASGSETQELTRSFAHYDVCGQAVKTIGPPNAQGKRLVASAVFAAVRPGTADNYFAFPVRSERTVTEADNSTQVLVTEQDFDFFTGLPTASRGPNPNEQTTYEYVDPLDRLTRTVRNLSPGQTGETRTEYGPAGLPVWVKVTAPITDSLETSATAYFDGMMKTTRTTRTDPDGEVTTETRYDGLGRPVLASNPYRTPQDDTYGWTRSTYDFLSRVVKVETASNLEMTAKRTGAVVSAFVGPQVTVMDQAGKLRRSLTDALGRIKTVIEPNENNALTLQTNYTYDARGNLRGTAQGEQARTFDYDALSRLTGATVPESGRTSYAYDAVSNLISRTDARSITTNYAYDELGRVLTKTYSDQTPDVRYFYDRTGLPPEAPSGFDRGASLGRLGATLTQPKAGRSVSVPPAVAGGLSASSTARDAKSVPPAVAGGSSLVPHPSSLASSPSGMFYNFDEGGRVRRAVQLTDGTFTECTMDYNRASLPTLEIRPSGLRLGMEYNEAAQATVVSQVTGPIRRPFASSIAYSPAGGLAKQTLGNGLTHEIGYNPRLQPVSIALGTAPKLGDRFALGYDYGLKVGSVYDQVQNNGNVNRITITPKLGATPQVQEFEYDTLNRLDTARETVGGTEAWAQTFEYDRFGNRTETQNRRQRDKETRKQTAPFSLPSSNSSLITHHSSRFVNNQLVGPGYRYDAVGNLIENPQGQGFSYDAENRLVEVRQGNVPGMNVIATYLYDGDGKRIRKTVLNENTWFVYDAGGALVEEYTDQTAVVVPVLEGILPGEVVWGGFFSTLPVTLTGRNLARVTHVHFNGFANSTILEVTDTQVKLEFFTGSWGTRGTYTVWVSTDDSQTSNTLFFNLGSQCGISRTTIVSATGDLQPVAPTQLVRGDTVLNPRPTFEGTAEYDVDLRGYSGPVQLLMPWELGMDYAGRSTSAAMRLECRVDGTKLLDLTMTAQTDAAENVTFGGDVIGRFFTFGPGQIFFRWELAPPPLAPIGFTVAGGAIRRVSYRVTGTVTPGENVPLPSIYAQQTGVPVWVECPLTAPVNVTATALPGTITVNWTDRTDEEYFEVEVTGPSQQTYLLPADTTEFVFDAAGDPTTFCFRVRAHRDFIFHSEWSEQVCRTSIPVPDPCESCSDCNQAGCEDCCPQNSLKVIAGTGKLGFGGDGGAATNAQLFNPNGTAFHQASQTLYIVDAGNRLLRKVDAKGVISTVAGRLGGATFSGEGKPAVDATLGEVRAVAVDQTTGDVHLSVGGDRVAKIDSKGLIRTFAGGGKATARQGVAARLAELGKIRALAVDGRGVLWIAAQGPKGGGRVYAVGQNGQILAVVGQDAPAASPADLNGDNGPASLARFGELTSLSVDPKTGDVLVGDRTQRRVRRASVSTGMISTVMGAGKTTVQSGVKASESAFQGEPASVAALADGGFLVAERGLNRPSVVWRVMPDGQIRTVAGGRLRYKPEPGGRTTVGTPDGLTVAGNLAYWSDSFGNQVLATEFGTVEKARTSSTQNPKLKIQNVFRRFGPAHIAPRTTEQLAVRKTNPKPQTPNPRQQTPQRRLLRQYIYGPSGLLAVIENNETRYLTPDHLGSPRVVTDSTGAVVSRRDFEPFGQEIPVGVGGRNAFDGYGNQDGIRQKFTGHERDDETGLDFAKARFYANGLGRFHSPDPLPVTQENFLNPQRWNVYVYVNNNPLSAIDRSGKQGKGNGGDKIISHFMLIGGDAVIQRPTGYDRPDFVKTNNIAYENGYSLNLHPRMIPAATFDEALASSELVVVTQHSTSQAQSIFVGPNAQDQTHYMAIGRLVIKGDPAKPDSRKLTLRPLVTANVLCIFSCNSAGNAISNAFRFVGRDFGITDAQFEVVVYSGPDKQTSANTLAKAADAFIQAYVQTEGTTEEKVQAGVEAANAVIKQDSNYVVNGVLINQGDFVVAIPR